MNSEIRFSYIPLDGQRPFGFGAKNECGTGCIRARLTILECPDMREGEGVDCEVCGRNWYVGKINKRGYFRILLRKGVKPAPVQYIEGFLSPAETDALFLACSGLCFPTRRNPRNQRYFIRQDGILRSLRSPAHQGPFVKQ